MIHRAGGMENCISLTRRTRRRSLSPVKLGPGVVPTNTKLLDPMEIQSWWDLLQPKWKGKLAVSIPGWRWRRRDLSLFDYFAGVGR